MSARPATPFPYAMPAFGATRGRWYVAVASHPDSAVATYVETRYSWLRTVKEKAPGLGRGLSLQSMMMGGTRLELVTSTMSTWRSNQLS